MTDDTDKNPPEEQTDDDGWGEAAVDAGWSSGSRGEPEALETAGELEAAEPPAELARAPEPPWSSGFSSSYPESEPEPEPEPPVHRYEELNTAVGIDDDEDEDRSERKKSGKKKRPPPDDDDEGGGGKRRRITTRTTVIALLLGMATVAAAALILLGNWNSQYYYFVCGTESITAERGRSFPPWGSAPLGGKQWAAIEIPPKAECEDERFEDQNELERKFAAALFEQAESRILTGGTENVTVASNQLEQALLLLRDPDQHDQRKKILRLQGDVEYARARTQAEAAATELAAAAKRFDHAAKNNPRHTRDSSEWAKFMRRLTQMIETGPSSLSGLPAPSGGANQSGTTTPLDAGVPPTDAEPGVALPPPADAKPAPIDAGLPAGGVLL